MTDLNFAGRRDLPEMGVVGEGDVVRGVPVQAVAVHVERHRVQHVIDRGHYLQVRAGKKSINANFCQRKETTDSFFFRHFQVKLSESSETELSIILALLVHCCFLKGPVYYDIFLPPPFM